MKQLIKSTAEMGPLAIFLIFYFNGDISTAIPPFIAATIIALPFLFLIEKKIPVFALASALFVIVFGSLTIYLDNETFFKMKPTVLYLITSMILISSLYFKKKLLKKLLNQSIQMSDTGWDVCTKIWSSFFIFLAALNELIWRTQSTDFWVNFKVFGVFILIFLFTIAQLPLINRYSPKSNRSEGNDHSL